MDIATAPARQPAVKKVPAKITRVETIPLRIAFRSPHKIASGGARTSAEFLLVRLHTDQDLIGIGETQAWRRHGSSETLASLTAVVNDHFAPQLIGKSPFDIAAVMSALDETIYHSQYAQAAIADAMMDLQGKLLGVPLHALLGGKSRDTISICGLLSIKPRLAETLDDVDQLLAAGYRTIVIKTDDDVAAGARAVAAVRKRCGDDVALRIDSNAGMTFDTALDLLTRIEPFRIQGAEQLLQIWDLDGTAELARRVTIPLIVDESVATDHDLINVIRQRAASGFQTKVAKNGGLWNTRKLWTVGNAAGMRICPGNHPCTSIATASVAHLAAAWPGPLLDGPFAFGLGALADDVVTAPMQIKNAAVRPPEGHGLGVVLDEKKIRKLRLDR